jgi:hypothetical protein
MTAAKIFVAIGFAASAFAQPSNPCDRRYYPIAGCKPIGQQMVDAVVDFRAKIAEESALIARARARFFATYPDKPGATEASAEFSKALHEKDCYYLWIYLNDRDPHVGTVMADPTLGKRVFDTLGGKLDDGIRQTAFPEFYDWAQEVRRNVGTIDITNALNVPARLLKALPTSEAKHEIYLQQRDWAEFDAAGREPVGLDDPALYFPALCVRFQEIPRSDAIKEYNGMVKALGEDVVQRAVQQVRAAPRDSGGRLLAVNTRDPVKRGPGGALTEDYTVPQPEGVIGVWASPIKAVEQLAIQGDDRRYLLWLLTERMRDFRLDTTHFHVVKWPFAETTYHRYVIAFGEPAVLEASRKVRTAVKRMTDGSVMDPKAIGGSTRNSPYYVFEDLVTRKDPRGYVRSLLAFNAHLTSAAEVDAAYQKFLSASNESAVLEAARKMAAGTPYPTSEADLKTLTSVLKGSLSLDKPAETLLDFSQYLAWKGFSAGAKVTYTFRALVPGRPGSNQLVPRPITGRQTYLLQSINDEQARLWLTERAYDLDGSAHQPRDTEIAYPAKIPQRPSGGPAVTLLESGQEKLVIGGKSIPTQWQSTTSRAYGCTVVTTTWVSDEVPSGLVRKTEDNTCPGTPRFVRETLLESFEGVRQPGFTNAPFPTPVAPAPAGTTAAPPAPATRAKGSATGVPPGPTVPGIIQRGGASPSVSTVNPVPVPTPGQPVQPASDRAASAQPVAPLPPVAAATPQMRDLSLRYADLVRRSAQAKAGVAQIEQQLARQRLGLRIDIVNARSRMDTQLRTAFEFIGRGDADQAEQSLRYAEAALGILEKFLGR